MTEEAWGQAFLSDYQAECEERLAEVRRGLLRLEEQEGQVPAPELLATLLRHFHTIKGLSGMVGLKAAEQLAHELESCLRRLMHPPQTYTSEVHEILRRGVQDLEALVATIEARQPSEGLVPDQEPASNTAGERTASAAPVTASTSRKPRLWFFEFIPKASLAARGINVDTIRARLQSLGEIVEAKPKLLGPGQVAFEFVVATDQDETSFAPWVQDGLRFRPYEPQKVSLSTPTARGAGAATGLVRVDLAKLDQLMQLVGELVISRAALEQSLRQVAEILPASHLRVLQERSLSIERQLRALREGIMRVRLVPIRELFTRLQFAAYDLARDQGKKITVELKGQETEIDKYIADRLLDPLLHVVRNLVSHGIETPEERQVRGKPPSGQIKLEAAMAGDLVVLRLSDDGRGIDPDHIIALARARGLWSATTPLDEKSLLDILCEPGFSTREQADLASGRGVGLAAVRSTVKELGGTLSLTTNPGTGTGFTLRLPLTLAIIDALIIRVSSEVMALPVAAVNEVFELTTMAITTWQGQELINYRGRILPLVRLARFFRLPDNGGAAYGLAAGDQETQVGLVVDRILGQRAIVVHTLSDPWLRVPGIAGATDLGDGRAVLILDLEGIVKACCSQPKLSRAKEGCHV